MIGCDIVQLSRFESRPDRFAQRILTNLEKNEYVKSKNKINYLAGRWACKEAIYKITGKVENLSILNDPTGKPFVFDCTELKISISHEKDYAIAVAIKI
jgi:holo-[acyl-carrier protein] synthase